MVFLIITIVVWLGDALVRYCYHKLRQLYTTTSQVPTVKYHRGNGEESVSLLNEAAAGLAAVIDQDDEVNDHDNEVNDHDDVTVDSSQDVIVTNEILEYDQV